jgi:hypothetical protein
MARKTIASLNIQVGASTATLQRDFRAAAAHVTGFKQNIGTAASTLNAFDAVRGQSTGGLANFGGALMKLGPAAAGIAIGLGVLAVGLKIGKALMHEVAAAFATSTAGPIKRANEAIAAATAAWKEWAEQIAIAVAPAIEWLAKAFMGLMDWVTGTTAGMRKAKAESAEWATIGAKMTEKFKSPAEKMREELREVDKAFAKGVISAATYGRAWDQLDESRIKAREETEKWAKIGEGLTDKFRTPMEKLRGEFEEIGAAVQRNVISWETAQRAAGDIGGRMLALEETHKKIAAGPTRFGAVTRGTTAGYSAVLAGQDAGKAMADHLREAKARDKRRNELLAMMHAELVAIGRKDAITKSEIRL